MDDLEWNVQQECHLLESMMGHKPIGNYITHCRNLSSPHVICRHKQIVPNVFNL